MSATRPPGLIYEFVVSAQDDGARLDQYLAAQQLPLTRSQIKRMLDRGACSVDGAPGRPATRLRAADTVLFTRPPPEPSTALPEQIPLDILFEDQHLIVVDKPAGMVVHPAPGHSSGTLVNALLGHSGQLAPGDDPLRPGIVHRLDKDTSGVMVATKTDAARLHLAQQFARHSMERRYLVLVSGALADARGTMDTLHGRHKHHRKRFSTRVNRGKRAVTHYQLLRRLTGATLVEARLQTGRTHQVRVHFADAGHPVLGDPVYGRAPTNPVAKAQAELLGRQALHARLLGFEHPVTSEQLCFETPPPEDMQAAIDALDPEQANKKQRMNKCPLQQ